MPPGTPSRSPNRRDLRRRGRRSPVPRSSSIFGSLKSFIVSPLSWFSSQENLQEDFEDTPGKRRRNPQVAERDEREHEEGDARAKRQRVHSPQPEAPQRRQRQPTAGYLDVPESLIRKHDIQPRHGRASSLVIPPSRRSGSRSDRHSLSPLAGPSHTEPLSIARTMSMDPPTGYRPRALSRGVSTGVLSTRDVTMAPSRTPFQVRSRSSMTPQPFGQAFGPAVPRLDRDTSVPPPLEKLTTNPVFVKPPSQTPPAPMLAMEPTLTLGSLVESQPRARRMSPFGQSRSTLGQSTSLLMSRSGSLDGGPNRTENPAERVLQDLDVYKTPLLPTRLRGSPGVPDMFKTRKMPIHVLMAGEHGKKTHRDSADREKEEPGAKPYAGKGGMKKLLARRKQEQREEQEERAKEKDSSMDDAQDEEPTQPKPPTQRDDVPALPRLTVPEFPPAPPAGRSSSLRVGRSKTSRTHAPSAQRGKNRFSAVDEEEGDEAMLTSEDARADKPPSLFTPPAGFSFSKDTAPIKLDSSASKEPPILSLPFSLDKQGSAFSKAATQGTPSIPQAPKERLNLRPSVFAQVNKEPATMVPTVAAGPAPTTAASAPATPSLQGMPTIALTPATPAAPPSAPSTESTEETASEIPNFFAKSSILLKPAAPIVLPTGPSLFGGSAPTASTSAPSSTSDETATAANPHVKGASKQPLFGSGASGAAANAGTAAGFFASPFGAATSSSLAPKAHGDASATSTSGAAATSIFGSAPITSAAQSSSTGLSFAFSAPAKPAEAASTGNSAFSFAPAKSAESTTSTVAPATSATTSQAFSFGAPGKPADNNATTSPFGFGAPMKPADASTPSVLGPPANIEKPASPAPLARGFSFGQPKDQQAKTSEGISTPATEPLKPSLFAGTSTSFSGFGGASSGISEPVKSSFEFGEPAAAATPAASAPTVQAPKPLFGGTSASSFPFGASAQGSTAPAEPAAPAKSPFSFGASPATPPAASTDKSSFAFGTTSGTSAPPQGSIMFGGPTGSSQGADVSKPFAFGVAAAPARPTTPPRHDQEVSMDESPVRGAGMDMNGQAGAKEPLKLTTGFPFGQPSSTSPFGQGPQSASSASPFSFGAASSGTSIFGGAKAEGKQEAKTSSAFGFGQPSGSGFGFGQKPADAPAPSVSPISFGGSGGFTQTSAPGVSAPFGFGPSTSSGSTGGFGQAAGASTTPSPSAFGSSSAAPFSFATPTSATTPSNPFSFGSQPASPATSNSGLPSATGINNSQFQFGQPAQVPAPAPATPFGAPAAPAGGPVFNIGAASAPAPPGSRIVKRLPTRRGGKR